MKRMHFTSNRESSSCIAPFDLNVIEPTDDDYKKFYHPSTKDWTIFRRDDKPGTVFMIHFAPGELTPVEDAPKVADAPKVENAPKVEDVPAEVEESSVAEQEPEAEPVVQENLTTDFSKIDVAKDYETRKREEAEEYLRKYCEDVYQGIAETKARREAEQNSRESAQDDAQGNSTATKVLAIVLTCLVAVGLVFFVSAALGCIAIGGPLLAGLFVAGDGAAS